MMCASSKTTLLLLLPTRYAETFCGGSKDQCCSPLHHLGVTVHLQVTSTWSVVTRMGSVPGPYIGAAVLPAIIIAILFYFDHNVSSQLAQQPEFNLTKPPAYAYDMVLLAVMVRACQDCWLLPCCCHRCPTMCAVLVVVHHAAVLSCHTIK